MHIKILYFGVLADISGKASELMDWSDGLDTAELKKKLFGKYPELENKKFKLAINQQIVEGVAVVPLASDIALLPPFAGG